MPSEWQHVCPNLTRHECQGAPCLILACGADVKGLQKADGSFAGDEWGEIDTRSSHLPACKWRSWRCLNHGFFEGHADFLTAPYPVCPCWAVWTPSTCLELQPSSLAAATSMGASDPLLEGSRMPAKVCPDPRTPIPPYFHSLLVGRRGLRQCSHWIPPLGPMHASYTRSGLPLQQSTGSLWGPLLCPVCVGGGPHALIPFCLSALITFCPCSLLLRGSAGHRGCPSSCRPRPAGQLAGGEAGDGGWSEWAS